MKRKNITVSTDELEDLKVINTLTGLNDSKAIAIGLKLLRQHIHNTAGIELKKAYENITDNLLSLIK